MENIFAQKIQSLWRGYFLRKQMTKLKQDYLNIYLNIENELPNTDISHFINIFERLQTVTKSIMSSNSNQQLIVDDILAIEHDSNLVKDIDSNLVTLNEKKEDILPDVNTDNSFSITECFHNESQNNINNDIMEEDSERHLLDSREDTNFPYKVNTDCILNDPINISSNILNIDSNEENNKPLQVPQHSLSPTILSKLKTKELSTFEQSNSNEYLFLSAADNNLNNKSLISLTTVSSMSVSMADDILVQQNNNISHTNPVSDAIVMQIKEDLNTIDERMDELNDIQSNIDNMPLAESICDDKSINTRSNIADLPLYTSNNNKLKMVDMHLDNANTNSHSSSNHLDIGGIDLDKSNNQSNIGNAQSNEYNKNKSYVENMQLDESSNNQLYITDVQSGESNINSDKPNSQSEIGDIESNGDTHFDKFNSNLLNFRDIQADGFNDQLNIDEDLNILHSISKNSEKDIEDTQKNLLNSMSFDKLSQIDIDKKKLQIVQDIIWLQKIIDERKQLLRKSSGISV